MRYFYEHYFYKTVPFIMVPFLVVMGWILLDAFLFVQQTPMVIIKGRVTNSYRKVDHATSCTWDSHHISSCSDQSSSSCMEDVAFETPSKLSISITSSCSGDHHYADMVDVVYPLANPFRARVIPPGGFLNRSVFILFFSTLFVTGLAIWQARRKQAEERRTPPNLWRYSWWR